MVGLDPTIHRDKEFFGRWMLGSRLSMTAEWTGARRVVDRRSVTPTPPSIRFAARSHQGGGGRKDSIRHPNFFFSDQVVDARARPRGGPGHDERREGAIALYFPRPLARRKARELEG